MRSVGSKELFAAFASKARIPCRDNSIADGNLDSTYNVLNNAGKVVLLDMSFSGPWREVPHFPWRALAM